MELDLVLAGLLGKQMGQLGGEQMLPAPQDLERRVGSIYSDRRKLELNSLHDHEPLWTRHEVAHRQARHGLRQCARRLNTRSESPNVGTMLPWDKGKRELEGVTRDSLGKWEIVVRSRSASDSRQDRRSNRYRPRGIGEFLVDCRALCTMKTRSRNCFNVRIPRNGAPDV